MRKGVEPDGLIEQSKLVVDVELKKSRFKGTGVAILVVTAAMLLMGGHTLTRTPISRSFMGFTLGEKFNYVLHYIESKYPPNQLIHADLAKTVPGEEIYRLFFPTVNITRIDLHFLDGVLYKFGVTFTQKYSTKVGWDGFVASAAKKYGPPNNTTKGFWGRLFETNVSASWDDGTTALHFLERHSNPEEGQVSVTYTDIRLRQEFKRRETKPPQF